jgi:CBS domain-containing protein
VSAEGTELPRGSGEVSQSRKLLGMITDRDLCRAVVAKGLDPKTTSIEKFVSLHPVTCREGENLEKCERAMQEHQLRRIPVINAEGRCIGILKEKPEKASKTVAEVSRPGTAA